MCTRILFLFLARNQRQLSNRLAMYTVVPIGWLISKAAQTLPCRNAVVPICYCIKLIHAFDVYDVNVDSRLRPGRLISQAPQLYDHPSRWCSLSSALSRGLMSCQLDHACIECARLVMNASQEKMASICELMGASKSDVTQVPQGTDQPAAAQIAAVASRFE